MKNTKTKMLCEAAIFIAMAEILSLIKLYEFPNGGSITLEMLPIILFAARYGCGWGSLAGLVYGTITYLIGNKFSIDWTTIICDYFLAFVALGFGAGLLYLTGIEDWETTISSVPAMGFNGIAVAFLGGLSPIGSILSAFFIQYITTGGGNVDLQVYCSQISSLISALIIYLCAFVGFFKYFIQTRLRKADERKAAKAAQIQEGGEDK